ncbi:MAG: tRNA (N6-isopentenyl adenosine(37)-C2)-methylthiotransferase MiaB [Oscillospiraceae bacterium]|nr:tRNA (N6-isopentenyl adenosine(37)-C2)-methylthiotransferase MiaB [Oscillospiraceae bacterium]
MEEKNTANENTAHYLSKARALIEARQQKAGRRLRAFTRHFGCQQNVADGERIDGMLAEMGYDFCDSPDGADLIIFNTCAVRENAEDRIFGNAGALKHQKARNPGLIIGLCGCMVQQKHIAAKLRKSYPHVDLLFGPSALPKLPELLCRKLEEKGRVFEILDPTAEIAEDLPVRRESGIKVLVSIMYGCDNFCSYCVVPYVRGRERSRGHAKILDDVRGLVGSGFKEIMLLGQNVNSYRDGGKDFVGLLRDICGIHGDFRLRFMTSHPKDCSRELIDTIAECGQIVKHLHLPVQSGSDRILEKMNRGYTARQYLDIIAYAKEKIPGVSFTGDVIVGFPGETYEDVQKTIALIREVGYQSLFTFIYSKRAGTAAEKLDDPVSDEQKGIWFRELLDVQNEISKAHYEKLVGSILTVLAEGKGKNGEGWLTGRTGSNIIVDFEAPESLTGSFVQVEITAALNWALKGNLIKI